MLRKAIARRGNGMEGGQIKEEYLNLDLYRIQNCPSGQYLENLFQGTVCPMYRRTEEKC